ILGFTDVLLRSPHAEAASVEMLTEIKNAGERAARLTQQLLAFGRKQVRQPQVLNLNAVVAGMGGMGRRLVGEDLEVVTDLAPGLGLVRADLNQLEQVVLNLAANARDAMPHGGKLTFHTCNVERTGSGAANLPGTRAGAFAVLAVRDT